MPNPMKSAEIEAADESAALKYNRQTSLPVGGSNLDIAFLHSDALVLINKRKKNHLQPLQWEMTLSPEEMFEEMTMELQSNP